MKQRILLFITIYFYFVLVFLIGKVIFTLIHASMGGGVAATDVFSVLYHGLPLDLSMSGYLTVIPGLLLIASIWFKPQLISRIFNTYYGIILAVIGIITVADLVVYPYWGFHFDSSVFLYIQKPKEALASGSPLDFVTGFLGTIAYVFIIFLGYFYLIRTQVLNLHVPKSIIKASLVLLLLIGFLFLPIRGGITVSTMNVGKVYFSDNMFLNHAAINPVFNLMYSLTKTDNFASQYQFFDKEETLTIFEDLNKELKSDSTLHLLNTNRPNILLFILESFSYDVALDSTIAPNMSKMAKEGILFSNFYANSFRTDRGLVSIMSSYPAHPTVAIMKYPQKTESLPTISRTLKDNGYKDMAFYYGGDADFANMRSYFVGACGISDIVSDKDFPLSERLTKWGAPDIFLIERVYADLVGKKQQEPFFKTVLTLSSHEPFDVPVDKFDEPFLNAIHYTDQCIGNFIAKLKDSDLWNNTLVIFLADHATQSYPREMGNSDSKRFHIPMIWTGGAIKDSTEIKEFSSQNDLAATLLSQLDIDHKDFKFSKNILNPTSRKFAFFSYVNGFCLMDSTGMVTYDNDREAVTEQKGNPELEKQAKAFFQTMYLDLGNR